MGKELRGKYLSFLLALSSAQFRFILFTEAISDREEVPTTLLVHVPYIGLLTSIFRVWFVNQMHQKEPKKFDNRNRHTQLKTLFSWDMKL